jgi:hypothetical protein
VEPICDVPRVAWEGEIIGWRGTFESRIDGVTVGNTLYYLTLDHEDLIDGGYNTYALYRRDLDSDRRPRRFMAETAARRIQRDGDTLVWTAGSLACCCCHRVSAMVSAMQLDGTNERTLAVSGPGEGEMADVVANGGEVFFEAYGGSRWRLWKVSEAGGEPQVLIDEYHGHSIAVDETHVYWYEFADDAMREVWRMRRGGGEPELVREQFRTQDIVAGSKHLFLVADDALWAAAKQGGGEAARLHEVHELMDKPLALDAWIYLREELGDTGERLSRTSQLDGSRCVLWENAGAKLRGFWHDDTRVTWVDPDGRMWQVPRPSAGAML